MAETASQLSDAKLTARQRYLDAFRWMLLARILEEKLARLYRAGMIVGGVYIGRGQEAFSAALGMQLNRQEGDVYAPLIRDQAGRLAFGEAILDATRTYLGSVKGPMRGRDGNIHRGRPKQGLIAMISHLGTAISVANGMLVAKRFRGETQSIGGVCIGDGGTSAGAFHEAVNQAAVEKLPLIIAVADNQFAYSTPRDRQFACKDLVDRAIGYGIEGYSIDGTDLNACLETFAKAAQRARSGHGPQMVVGHLLRLSGHGEHDDASYIAPELKNQQYGGDCLEISTAHILGQEWMDETEMEALKAELQEQVDEAVATAQKEPAPDPFQESWHALATKHLTEGTPGI